MPVRGTGITIRDVARTAGVSKTTAAYVLTSAPGFHVQEATRHRILSAASQLGYRRNAVAAALSSGRLNTIGVLLPLHQVTPKHLPSSTYFKDALVAVAEAAACAGLRLTIVPIEPGIALSAQEVADQRVDAVVSISLNDRPLIEGIYHLGMPCVEIGTAFGTQAVYPDNDGGVAAAVAHLAGLGHRRIAHLRGCDGNFTAARRAAAFQRAALQQGLRPEEAVIVSDLAGIARLLRQPAGERPTAIFAFNDHLACSVLDLAHDTGLRVPDDLSVVGFDDNSLAEMARPRLTTVHNPLCEQAAAAIARLHALWRGEPDPAPVTVVPTCLILRHSTAPAPIFVRAGATVPGAEMPPASRGGNYAS